MFTMYDDVTLSLIPNRPHAVASYINGKFANHDEAKRRFPHAHHLSISVTGDVPADCYDIERGDYIPEQAPGLVRVARDAGVWRPCLYADLSTMPQVKARLGEAGIDRNEVRLWVASWDDVPLVPPGYDAKQFTDHALGRSLDESVCVDGFFRPAGKPAEKLDAALVEHDADSGEWRIAPHPTVTTTEAA